MNNLREIVWRQTELRYYRCIIQGTENKIKELLNEREMLKGYRFAEPIRAVNDYMFQTLKNNYAFMAYRQELKDSILAIFCFDEIEETLENAYDYIMEELKIAFDIKKKVKSPVEITMYEYMECYLEARRRGLESALKFVNISNLVIYEYGIRNEKKYHFKLEETIISEKMNSQMEICDESFKKELLNIEQHVNKTEYIGNSVHYIISDRSIEAAREMTGKLALTLAKAKRISSMRMEVISEIETELYKYGNELEDIIENNYGGVVIIDLTEKFGFKPVDYQMTCKFIEKLVKKYNKKCLFVFTYNINNPGFSYYLIPNLKKYIIPIYLKEGTGSRKSAVKYMKRLITASDYSKFANQANEFMKRFSAEKFTQTDVIRSYEQFEAWCLNTNILKAYNFEISDDFMLDRDKEDFSSKDKLSKMIGLDSVKSRISTIIATDIVERERKKRKGNTYKTRAMHMIFAGNPGSAKTTVAKLFAGIAKDEGILKSGIFVECGGMDLDGLGAPEVIRETFASAKGGVLFIDEAYSLNGDTAITALIQEMENHRNDVIVILAGYNDRMKTFMKKNEGLKSRIPFWIDFPDYNAEELTDIFRLMVDERGFNVTEDAVKEAHYIFEKVCHNDNFGNGRYVRNILENAIQQQSVRLLKKRESSEDIQKRELFTLIKEDVCMPERDIVVKKKHGDAKKELQNMIGLTNTKVIIKKIIASFKLRKLCMDRGIAKDKASLHMVFTGNPGTAKTTVARLFADILKDENILSTGSFVEVGRADLIGEYVGRTAPLVKKRFKEAQGGILFIDEAYSLLDSYENGYGDEAINAIVQEMENNRDNVIVIFAGYPDKMKHFLNRNPGLLSRIAFQVEFDDYSTEELCEITKLILKKKNMRVTALAIEKLCNIYENARVNNDFGNGRFVRKIIEEAEMNMAVRLLKLNESEITENLLSVIEECDIPDYKPENKEIKTIGFCV